MKRMKINFNGKEDQAAIRKYVKSIDTVKNEDVLDIEKTKLQAGTNTRRIYSD